MKIEQMLHGYDNGHRLLAGSVILKSHSDMDTIATLSDWSEYVAGDGRESSYVTAYPLKESRYYVIAKTWYADEKKRPGCVWTHSLLLPLDSLNSLDDFKRISSLFKRPSEENDFVDYSHQIDYENKQYSREDYQPLTVDRGIAALVMVSFLTAKNSNLTFGGVSNNRPYEDLMLGAMTTIPMQLLQYVSWTSGTCYVRKLEGKPLTCQVLSGSSENLNKANVNETLPWISYVVDALMQGDVNQGQLIRMFAEDINDNVEYYAAVVSVLYTLEDYLKTGKDEDERYKDVFEIIAKSFPTKTEGHIIKKLCASKTFSNKYCDDKTFFYFFATLPLDGVFDTTDSNIDQRWNEYIETETGEYLALMSRICASGQANEWGMKVIRDSAGNLSETDVTYLVENDYHLFSTITHLSPVILDKIKWELLSKENVETLLPLILDERTRNGFTHWGSLFKALLENSVEINWQLASLMFSHSAEATKILFDYVNLEPSRCVNYSLGMQLSRHTDDVMKWLAGAEDITENVAYAIVNCVDEKAPVVVSSGSTLWKPFLGLQYHSLRTEVYSYLFAVSFNWPFEKTALELMRMAFEPLHKLESIGELSYSNWARIAPFMEPVKIWEEWDKCKKMRKTVVKRLKRAGVDKNVLTSFTSDRELNEQLMRMW
ncbi:MAG: hypothetical protein PUH91_00440 [Prevotella sp.]|nr:hypothetical protein [Prevotella sp.]